MPSPGWEVVRVSKHLVPVITDLRLSGNNLQYQTTDIYVERCESGPNETWITWHEAGAECEEETVSPGAQSGEYEPSADYGSPESDNGSDYGSLYNSPTFEAV